MATALFLIALILALIVGVVLLVRASRRAHSQASTRRFGVPLSPSRRDGRAPQSSDGFVHISGLDPFSQASHPAMRTDDASQSSSGFSTGGDFGGSSYSSGSECSSSYSDSSSSSCDGGGGGGD